MYTHTRISALTLRTSKFHANVNSILLFSWTLILYTLNIRPICLKVNDFASFYLKTGKLQARNRQMQYDKNSANRFAKNDKRKINTLAGDADHSGQIDFLCVCVANHCTEHGYKSTPTAPMMDTVSACTSCYMWVRHLGKKISLLSCFAITVE